jgi:hypothetical protein
MKSFRDSGFQGSDDRNQGSGRISNGCTAENQGLGMTLDVHWGFLLLPFWRKAPQKLPIPDSWHLIPENDASRRLLRFPTLADSRRHSQAHDPNGRRNRPSC